MSETLPTVDIDFVLEKLEETGKFIEDSKRKVGSTYTYILKGSKPLHKRSVLIRHVDGQVNFNQATGLASIYRFLGSLLTWLEENRDWKEGGYSKTTKKKIKE